MTNDNEIMTNDNDKEPFDAYEYSIIQETTRKERIKALKEKFENFNKAEIKNTLNKTFEEVLNEKDKKYNVFYNIAKEISAEMWELEDMLKTNLINWIENGISSVQEESKLSKENKSTFYFGPLDKEKDWARHTNKEAHKSKKCIDCFNKENKD